MLTHSVNSVVEFFRSLLYILHNSMFSSNLNLMFFVLLRLVISGQGARHGTPLGGERRSSMATTASSSARLGLEDKLLKSRELKRRELQPAQR